MSIVTGGIFGRVRNKTADLVFSQARSRSGTVNTIRQLVIPTNPRTPSQSTNRGKFAQLTQSLRAIGLPNIQASLNRAVDELPAFQSLMSLLMIALKDADNPTAVPSITLGPDFTLSEDTITPGTGSADTDIQFQAGVEGSEEATVRCIALEWSDEALISTDILAKYGEATKTGGGTMSTYCSTRYGTGSSNTNGLYVAWIESSDGLQKGELISGLYTPA